MEENKIEFAENEENHIENYRHHSHSKRRYSHSHHQANPKTNSRKKQKLKKFIKKYRKQIILLAIIVILASVLIMWAAIYDNIDNHKYDKPEDTIATEKIEGAVQIKIPLFGDSVCLVSPAVEEYLSPDFDGDLKALYNKYKVLGRLDEGLPVRLFYSIDGIPIGFSVTSAVIEVSQNSDFYSPAVYQLNTDENYVDVYSLKVNTQYYYRVNITLSDGQSISSTGSFVTANTPRMLKIDGAANVRDIGGRTTTSDKTVRQGLLFRGSELDGAVNPDYTVTASGINEMLTVLGIKTDLDLRPQSDNPAGIDALGMNVRHIYIPSTQYSGIFDAGSQPNIRKIFAELANPNNYPIYLHCTHGLDRTGTICYLLEAVLGMSEKELLRDYELSAMYHKTVNTTEMATMISNLKKFEGDTIQKKVENYLLSIGVTSKEISDIKEIFLEN